MSFTRKSIADHLDSYDDEIAELQDGKRDTLNDYRQQLADAGMGKAQIKAEIEALKAAMRRRRAIAKKGNETVEEADALADEIFVEITSSARRATPAREIIEEFPPHDPETGELTDTQEQPETARTEPADAAVTAGNDLREPVAAEQGQIIREGDAPRETDRVSGDASCPDTESQSDAASSDAVADPQAPQSATATLSDDDVPAFLKADRPIKAARDYRPHCQHPEACGSSGLHHCYTCSKALAESEAA